MIMVKCIKVYHTSPPHLEFEKDSYLRPTILFHEKLGHNFKKTTHTLPNLWYAVFIYFRSVSWSNFLYHLKKF